MNKSNMAAQASKQPCLEIPFFGAHYPDARCINGYLWDLDRCDEDGNLYGGSLVFHAFKEVKS